MVTALGSSVKWPLVGMTLRDLYVSIVGPSQIVHVTLNTINGVGPLVFFLPFGLSPILKLMSL